MRSVRKNNNGSGRKGLRSAVLVSGVGFLLGGCKQTLDYFGNINSFLDPTESNIRPLNSPPLIKPILDTLDPSVEEVNDEFPNATDVEPDDLKADTGDYHIGKNDLVSVTIYDLLGEGTGETVKNVRVTESGNISLDFIKPVHAEGLTETELQDAIRQAYADAGQIRNARVSVEVSEERARVFSIAGNVGQEGQYQILQNDFRVLDALVIGRGPAQADGVEYCYVIRQPEKPPEPPPVVTPEAEPSQTTQPAAPPTTELLQPPQSRANPANSPDQIRLLATSGDTGSDASQPSGLLAPENYGQTNAVVEGQSLPLGPAKQPPATNPSDQSFQFNAPAATTEPSPSTPPPAAQTPTVPNLPVAQTAPTESTPPATEAPTITSNEPLATSPAGTEQVGGTPNGLQGFQFNTPTTSEQRIIRIPLRELLAGQLQFNIVIRPGDLIYVPEPITGEFYMGGHVQRTGPYSLTGRKITLKQAIVSAGMFDQVAIPGRSEIIRRIGTDKEAFVRIDIDKVFAGEQPDVYLKPNDIVMVGTNVIAPFLAAFRNGFRITYGFGFLYDINYAPQQNQGVP